MVSYIDKIEEYDKLVPKFLKERAMIAVDTETTGLDPFTSKLLLIQIGDTDNQLVINYQKLKNAGCDFKILKEVFESDQVFKVLHNAKFDYKMIKHHMNIELKQIYCTFVIENLLKKGIRQKGFSLADLAYNYLNIDMDKSVRASFHNSEDLEFTEEQIKYSAVDIECLIPILTRQLELVKEWAILPLVTIECQAIAPTADMELNGVYLNPAKWKALFSKSEESRAKAEIELAEELGDTLVKYKATLRQEALEREKAQIKKKVDKVQAKNANAMTLFPCDQTQLVAALAETNVPKLESFPVNLNSATQLKEILSLHIGKDVDSTEEEQLLKLGNYPIIPKIITYRKASKLCTTYGEEFLAKGIHPVTGRIHTNFNQTRADSGRYSSSDPVNLQNIPRAAEYRAAFTVQDPSWKMICADYSGCELRLIAEICDEPKWIKAFQAGYDLHSFVASMLYKIPYNTIVDQNHTVLPEYKEFRSKAKTLVFGITYGMKAGRLSYQLQVTPKEASDLLNKFWKEFPSIQVKLTEFAENAVTKKYAYSPLDGRRRSLGNFDMALSRERAHAENIAKNLPFQGGNASIIKRALVYIKNGAESRGWDASKFRILMTIHDEVEAECVGSIAEEALLMVEQKMIDAAHFYVKKVPMAVDIKIADHWVH